MIPLKNLVSLNSFIFGGLRLLSRGAFYWLDKEHGAVQYIASLSSSLLATCLNRALRKSNQSA